jgi:hypothetical protein
MPHKKIIAEHIVAFPAFAYSTAGSSLSAIVKLATHPSFAELRLLRQNRRWQKLMASV